MAERPYVVNAYVINLLNAAPVENMRPSLGSLIQRKTIDIGCYPFPFMVDENNVPLDGRGNGTRLVPYWCSENTYARVYGDQTYNNGNIVWNNGIGKIVSRSSGFSAAAYQYDSQLGVTYPTFRINTAFIGLDNTVPVEWLSLRDSYFSAQGSEDRPKFGEGATFNIANNIVFKIWSGLTITPINNGLDGSTFTLDLMRTYAAAGGTYSGLLDRYNYECLDQVFNNPAFGVVGIDPNSFWEGSGASFGSSGSLTGENFLLATVLGGDNSGSLFVYEKPTDPFYEQIVGGASGSTLTGKDLAVNIYSLGNPTPFVGPRDPAGGYIDTMALLMGTNQKIGVLVGTGGTASLRALDFNNPCAASFKYREDTELGVWGYEVEKIEVSEEPFEGDGGVAEIGCNVPTFIEYINGPSAAADGIPHPVSWIFWKKPTNSSDYVQGYVNAPVQSEEGLTIERLEGIHDHLCYEYYEGQTLKSRIYYPINPLNKDWYDANVGVKYTSADVGAQSFGSTIDKKYETAFPETFSGAGSFPNPISLKTLVTTVINGGLETIELKDSIGSNRILSSLKGSMFPYFIPLASMGMSGIGDNAQGALDISGEFSNFEGRWTEQNLLVEGSTELQERYRYYADGVSSAASFETNAPAPLVVEISSKPDFRLFSWNALSRIQPLIKGTQTPLKSSFQFIPQSGQANDILGSLQYGASTTSNKQTITIGDSEIILNPLSYPPAALDTSSSFGLEYRTDTPLSCPNYISVIRNANTNSTDASNPGLTAHKTLIAQEQFGVNLRNTVGDFENTAGNVPANWSFNFYRVFSSGPDNHPNVLGSFYSQWSSTVLLGAKNFFFTDTNSPTISANTDKLVVFGSPYYLSEAEWEIAYGGGGQENPPLNWWENVDTRNYNINGTVSAIRDLLSNPNPEDKWNTDVNADLPYLKASPYLNTDGDLQLDALTTGNGIERALGKGLHPSFVYRLFTTNAFGFFDAFDDNQTQTAYTSCAKGWTAGRSENGTIRIYDCDELPEVNFLLQNLSYFTAGETGCGQYGLTDPTQATDTPDGADFFGRFKIKRETSSGIGGTVPVQYAYFSSYFAPNSEDYNFQNQNCVSGSGSVSDPPIGATLTSFGLTFAQALAGISFGSFQTDYTNKKFLRDSVFGYTGSTAPTANNFQYTVADWLQGKLEAMLQYFNTNRLNTNPQIQANVQKIREVFTEMYGNLFSNYDGEFENVKKYELWAIQPRCVREWDADCRRIANESFLRFASFDPSTVFYSEEVDSDIPPEKIRTRPSISQIQKPTGINTTAITTDDIIPKNEGFISAFRTVYIEPLGKATDVLATEAQAVPRATISSTVFGKISTVIDSSGFLRDVNVITFESGFGTKITGNSGSNTVTFAVEGLTLGSLGDISFSTGPSQNDVLIYDTELGKWINVPFSTMMLQYGGWTADENFFYQTTPPTEGITLGSRWMDSNTGIEYIYIDDGDSNQWIQAV